MPGSDRSTAAMAAQRADLVTAQLAVPSHLTAKRPHTDNAQIGTNMSDAGQHAVRWQVTWYEGPIFSGRTFQTEATALASADRLRACAGVKEVKVSELRGPSAARLEDSCSCGGGALSGHDALCPENDATSPRT